jgi:hypothetical protein
MKPFAEPFQFADVRLSTTNLLEPLDKTAHRLPITLSGRVLFRLKRVLDHFWHE